MTPSLFQGMSVLFLLGLQTVTAEVVCTAIVPAPDNATCGIVGRITKGTKIIKDIYGTQFLDPTKCAALCYSTSGCMSFNSNGQFCELNSGTQAEAGLYVYPASVYRGDDLSCFRCADPTLATSTTLSLLPSSATSSTQTSADVTSSDSSLSTVSPTAASTDVTSSDSTLPTMSSKFASSTVTSAPASTGTGCMALNPEPVDTVCGAPAFSGEMAKVFFGSNTNDEGSSVQACANYCSTFSSCSGIIFGGEGDCFALSSNFIDSIVILAPSRFAAYDINCFSCPGTPSTSSSSVVSSTTVTSDVTTSDPSLPTISSVYFNSTTSSQPTLTTTYPTVSSGFPIVPGNSTGGFNASITPPYPMTTPSASRVLSTSTTESSVSSGYPIVPGNSTGGFNASITPPYPMTTPSASRFSSTSATSESSISSATLGASTVTETITSTNIHTVTSCAPGTGCSIGNVVTNIITRTTTYCPGNQTPAVTSSPPKPTIPSGYTISTVYSTYTSTILQCPTLVTDCPLDNITTEIVDVYTTVCPIAGAQGQQTRSGVTPAHPTGLIGSSHIQAHGRPGNTALIGGVPTQSTAGGQGGSGSDNIPSAASSPVVTGGEGSSLLYPTRAGSSVPAAGTAVASGVTSIALGISSSRVPESTSVQVSAGGIVSVRIAGIVLSALACVLIL